MPWRETSVMEERLRFVARLLEGDCMSEVCRAFGISRKTGHKIFSRYKAHGVEALADRARKPGRVANRLPMPVDASIVALRREKPHLGRAQAARAARPPARRRCAGPGPLDDPRGAGTLKGETCRPAGANSLAQQARFDAFLDEFNRERPHEALGMKTPAGSTPPPAPLRRDRPA